MKRLASIYLIMVSLFIQSISFAADTNLQAKDGKTVVLHDDYTWEYVNSVTYNYDFSTIEDNQIPSFLRQGISVDRTIVVTAVEMYLQGWRYTMPVPKSAQAAWGNGDGRTTWWYGYWYNASTKAVSNSTPVRKKNGHYYGDGQDQSNYYRNGGSPSWPTKLEWLLSESGGVKPNSE